MSGVVGMLPRLARFPVEWAVAGGAALILLIVCSLTAGTRPLAVLFLIVTAVAATRIWGWVRACGRTVGGLAVDRLTHRVPSTVGVEHRELTRRIRQTWPAVADRAGLTVKETRLGSQFIPGGALGLVGRHERTEEQVFCPPDIVGVESRAGALCVTVAVPTGLSPERFNQPAIFASSWRVPSCEVKSAGPGRVTIFARTRADATDRTWAYPTVLQSSAEWAPFAVDQDGQLVAAGLLESSMLIGGLPGSGKSGALSALLASIGSVANVALYGLDPKVLELAPWRDRFTEIATSDESMTALLEHLVCEMDARYQWLAARGVKKLTPNDLVDQPMIAVVVDELAEVIGSGISKEEKAADSARATMLRRLLQKGRAAGVVVIAATQKPDATIVPTALRDLFTQRLVLRTSNAAMTQVVMGGWTEGAVAHDLPGNGTAFFVREGLRQPVRVRCLWVPDDECVIRARAVADLRIGAPWGAGEVTGA